MLHATSVMLDQLVILPLIRSQLTFLDGQVDEDIDLVSDMCVRPRGHSASCYDVDDFQAISHA